MGEGIIAVGNSHGRGSHHDEGRGVPTCHLEVALDYRLEIRVAVRIREGVKKHRIKSVAMGCRAMCAQWRYPSIDDGGMRLLQRFRVHRNVVEGVVVAVKGNKVVLPTSLVDLNALNGSSTPLGKVNTESIKLFGHPPSANPEEKAAPRQYVHRRKLAGVTQRPAIGRHQDTGTKLDCVRGRGNCSHHNCTIEHLVSR